MLNNRKLANLSFILAFVSATVYLLWRAFFTLPWQDGILALAFGLLLLASEITSSLGSFELYLRKAQSTKVDLTLPQIPASWYPDVDVLIATHNEDPELLYKTVNACTHFDYPDPGKVHIYLCDDGNRQSVEQLAQHFGVGYLGLANNKEAKSGNYNNALRLTDSPLIATFDADMIGRHTFLMETVPYFYLPYVKRDENGEWVPRMPEEVDPNDKIGLIQTPQSFYNPDLFQFNLYAERNIPNEQDFFSREINIMRNSVNAIAYTGSNTLISRQAMKDIGNFPTDTITEDFETGLKIQAMGYTCYATEKVQASGLATTTIKSMITQRVRWARGVIQSIRNCNVLFNPNLSADAKWSYMSSFLYWWSFAQRLVYTLAPILFALFDLRIVNCTVEQLLLFWAPNAFFHRIAQRFFSSNIRNQRWNQIVDITLAPYMVIPVLLETIGIQQKKFKVTDKKKKQKDRKLLYLVPQIVLLGLSLAALVRFTAGKSGAALLYSSFIIFWLLFNIVTLIYAVFFMMGRRAYRMSERFNARIPLRVSYGGYAIETVTENVSEGGIMFTLPQPVFVPDQIPLEMTLSNERYQVSMTAQMLYVDSEAGLWRYHCAVVRMSEPNWRHYLQMIYDRPHSLPKEMNMWMTVVDDILNNQYQRMRKPVMARRAEPRVLIDRFVRFAEGGYCSVVDFSYRYLLVRNMVLPRKHPAQLTIRLNDHCRIVCKPIKGRPLEPNEHLMQVLNLDEIMQSEDFLKALTDWAALPDPNTAVEMRKRRAKA
ncbi:MAG: glycosyltransferase [Candidatus Limiplasma sp.]|nr:glycosyltransferase [Candidatus Limiplasma sp.]